MMRPAPQGERDDGRCVQRQGLRDDKPADDGDTDRLAQMVASAKGPRKRYRPQKCGQGGQARPLSIYSPTRLCLARAASGRLPRRVARPHRTSSGLGYSGVHGARWPVRTLFAECCRSLQSRLRGPLSALSQRSWADRRARARKRREIPGLDAPFLGVGIANHERGFLSGSFCRDSPSTSLNAEAMRKVIKAKMRSQRKAAARNPLSALVTRA